MILLLSALVKTVAHAGGTVVTSTPTPRKQKIKKKGKKRKNTYTNGKIKVEINKNRRILFKYAYFFTIFLEKYMFLNGKSMLFASDRFALIMLSFYNFK